MREVSLGLCMQFKALVLFVRMHCMSISALPKLEYPLCLVLPPSSYSVPRALLDIDSIDVLVRK